jgi:MarR-like DNA-binding transcriptional regulator SgrR of sgrS sRNA
VAITDLDQGRLSDRIRPLVFETLVEVDPAGGLRPVLAESWDSDAAGARWRFRVRRGVTLHDGSPLEAWKVAAALRTTDTAWTVSTDGDVVVVEPAKPERDLPWALADPRHAIAVRRSAAELVGSGPFRIDRLENGRATLKAHDAHWAGRPFVDSVQVDFQRSLRTQLADLESGRADLVELQPADVRRVTERGLRVAATRPIDLLVLVFEPHRTEPPSTPARRLFAGTLDRSTIASVLLQGRAEPARSLLPSWLSGYSSELVAATIPRSARATVLALPATQRTLTLRVDPSDTAAHAIADRIAEDAREAGFTVTVQAPTGLASRPDVQLVRATLESTSPDRSLVRLGPELGSRTLSLATAGPALSAGASLDAVVRFERGILDGFVVIPVVRVPELFGLGDAVDTSEGDAVGPTGRWNFANLWIRSAVRERP